MDQMDQITFPSGIPSGIPYSPPAYRESQAPGTDRQERIENAGPVPVEGMSPQQISAYTAYADSALSHIETLRFPPGLDLKRALPQQVQTQPPSASPTSGTDMTYFENLAQTLGHSVGPDGKEMPLTDEQKLTLAKGLSRFDRKALERLKEMGMKINIYDHKNPPPEGFPGGPLDDKSTWEANKAGYYQRDKKLICLRADRVNKDSPEDQIGTITHEIGHAVDDLLEADEPSGSLLSTNLLTFDDKRIKDLYDKYMERSKELSFGSLNPVWSDYAMKNEQEYFAEGVRMYTAGGKDMEILKTKDPELYKYVEEKLSKAESPLPEYKPPEFKPIEMTEADIESFRKRFAVPQNISEAILTGNVESLKELITKYPDMVKQGIMGELTPMHVVVNGGIHSKEIVELLIGAGADINAKDSAGNTPLKLATMSGETEIAEILKAHGAKE